MKKLTGSFYVAWLAMLSCSAYADGYAGIGVSRVDASYAGSSADAGDANGITVYGGKRFDHIGLEFGYTDVGDIDVPDSSIVVSGNIVKLQASLFTNATSDFLLFANLGMALWDLQNNIGYSESDTELAWMLGMEYKFTQQLAGRVDYEQYSDLGGADLDILTLSINMRF